MSGFKSLAVASLLATSLAAPSEHHNHKRQAAASVIYSCTVPGTVALTFDDGPAGYTGQLLDILNRAGHKATFFVNGQNYGNINDNAAVVRRIVNEGHQLASHTWSHADLGTLDAAGVTSQMTQLENALIGIVGKFGTYMRPPFLSFNQNTLTTLGGLGYKVIDVDIDTLDWQNQSPSAIETSAQNFQAGINRGGTISLAHDPNQYTVQNLAGRMVQILAAKGLKSVPVGQCLGDPAANWYRTSRSGTSSPIFFSQASSPDRTAYAPVP
jgi:peptidoglycan/xylan/chitin deacetylase (PgdA/CDA1 family)